MRSPLPTRSPARALRATAFLGGLACCLVFASGGAAWAYLDPGTAALILQSIAGGVAGLLVVMKLYWSRIRRLFGLLPRDRRQDRSAEQPDQA